MQALVAKHGHDVCAALPGLHAFTGCDSTSAFAGRGKKAGLTIVSSTNYGRQAMTQLGSDASVSDDLLIICERFVCTLYGSKTHIAVNDLHHAMFCSGTTESSKLPLTKYALKKHVLPANYQAAIWRKALTAKPVLPEPDGHGWLVQDSQLLIDWMDQQPAPLELLELVSCSCAAGCITARCSCPKASLPCTDACACENCDNAATTEVEDGTDRSDDQLDQSNCDHTSDCDPEL